MKVTTAKFAFPIVLMMVAFNASFQAQAQDPSEFLRRLDANGNGNLDPNEVEGRFGFFIRRMAENNPRIDLSRPIPISRLAEEFQRMREQRGMGGGPPGGGPPGGGPPSRGRGDSGRGDSGRGDSARGDRGGSSRESSPYQSRTTSVEPLVPGFGIEDVFTPPPGFGAEAELFTVEVTDDDRREAQRAFGYYDRNRDGKIDKGEMGRSRYGADLPMYDKNRDGIITMNEMEYRYARRRIENTRAGGSSGNQNASRSGRGRGSGDEDSEDRDRYRFEDQRSYRIVAAIERLPAGLPDWFARNDADGDGQISMSEFSASWTDSVFDEFDQFDLNQDGLITPQECLKAGERGMSLGDSVASAPSDDSSSSSGSSASSSSSPSVSIEGLDPRYVAYYKKLFEKYDSNGDGKLGPDEWVNMSKNPEAADANGDKLISVEEYAVWSMKR
jgi:Ca2+-binding EF-hand superfamily protein